MKMKNNIDYNDKTIIIVEMKIIYKSKQNKLIVIVILINNNNSFMKSFNYIIGLIVSIND